MDGRFVDAFARGQHERAGWPIEAANLYSQALDRIVVTTGKRRITREEAIELMWIAADALEEAGHEDCEYVRWRAGIEERSSD